jgi:transketolase
VPVVLDPSTYHFTIGRAQRLRGGSDVGIVASGFMTQHALEAAEALSRRGIKIAVLHLPTLKPLDAEAVCEFAASTDKLVTAENHVTSGGLASLVDDALFNGGVTRPLTRIGLPDRFIECGSVPNLQDRYGLSTNRVIEKVESLT